MKKIYSLLLAMIFLSTSLIAQTKYYSKSGSTDFNSLSTWGTATDGTGTNPTAILSTDTFVVANSVNLSLSADASVAKLLVSSGTLTVAANNLTVSHAGSLRNSSLSIASGAKLTVSGGTVNVNGQFAMVSGAQFAQSGGTINVDGNDAGIVANSVTGNIVQLYSVVAADLQLTGGTIVVVDPSPGTAYAISGNCAVATAATAGHTVQYGNGTSTDAGGTNGFYSYQFPGASYFIFGNVIANGGTGTNRFVTTLSNHGIVGNLTVNASSEYRIASTHYIKGNVINNGTLTTTSTLGFADYTTAATFTVTTPQSISGSGVFRNSTTATTANVVSFYCANTSITGVTVPSIATTTGQPANTFSASGTLTFAANGTRITMPSGMFVLGISGTAGTLTMTSTTNAGFSAGTKFGRWWAAAGTGSAITVGTDPVTTNTSRYPFITSQATGSATRSFWITRATPSAAGGILAVNFTNAGGTSTSSIVDGTYTATLRSNDNWTVSAEQGTPTAAASLAAYIVAPGVYGTTPPDNTSRVTLASAVTGTFNNGTTTPGAYRTAITPANIINTFYIAMNIPQCSGTPVGGTAAASTTLVCPPSATTNLSVTGQATGLGLTYQWQSSPAGANTFTDISGATALTYTATVTAATDYRLVTTCTASGLSGNSTVITVNQVPVTLVSTVASAPATYQLGNTVTLSLTGLGVGPTYTYQWQSNTGSGFTNIAGATLSTYPFTVLNTTTTYQCIVTACAGASTGTSSIFTPSPSAGYCTVSPTAQTSWFSSLTSAGGSPTNINHTAAAGVAPGYRNLTTTQIVSNYIGQTVTFSITNGGPTCGNAIWIDWNNNNLFEASEKVFATTTFITSVTTPAISIPSVTANGNYRIRFVTDYNNSAPTDPCAAISRGEYIDATFTVVAAPSCTPPTALTNTVLSTTAANHSWNAASPVPSVGYEWAVTTSATPPASGTATAGLTASSTGLTPNTTYYLHVRSDCGAGLFSTWTTSSFYSGYCLASSTNATPSWISVFNTTGGVTNINHSAAAAAAGGYANLTASSLSNYLGQTTNFTLTNGGPTCGNAIWIDWNNNLIFETTERVYVTTGYGTTVTGTIAIPAAQANGNYTMRVISDYNNSAPSNPCGLITRGEYKDFTFSVVNAPACIAPTALMNSIVNTTSASHSWTAASPVPSNGYQWALTTSATPPASGTATTGVTASSTGLTFGTTYYLHVRSDCGAGLFSSWTTSAAFIFSYCVPPAPTSGCSGDNIASVVLGTLSDLALTCTPVYEDRSLVQPGTVSIPSLTQLSTPAMSVAVGNGGTEYVGVWIDFDQNGIFDATEFTALGSGNNVTVSGTVNIPLSALTGNTKMRVRTKYNAAFAAADACTQVSYGTTRDYFVNIVAAPVCTGTPGGLTVTPSVSNYCSSTNSTTLSVGVGSGGGVGITYQWESSPAGTNTFTPISGATNSTYAATNVSSSTDYRCVVTCSSNSGTSPIATIILSNTPANDDCTNAINVVTQPDNPTCTGTTVANTNCATTSSNTSNSWATSQDDDIWYKFTATSTTQTIKISNAIFTGGATTIGISVYNDGANCANALAATELPVASVPATITLTSGAGSGSIGGLTVGTTYTLRLLTGGTGSRVTFNFCLQDPPLTPPNCATALLPATGATNVSTIPNLVLSWTAPTGSSAPTSYDVYISATTPIPAATTAINSTSTSLSLVGASASTTYYWYVVPKNAAGSATGCNVEQNFTTSAVCNPSTTNGGNNGDAMTAFILNGEASTAISITGATPIATPGYIDLTATTTVNLAQGKAYSGSVSCQDAADYVSIWIDWNNNGGFEANEKVLDNISTLGANTTSPFSILVPPTATLGNHKMRVRDVYYSAAPTAPTAPCSNYSYGESKDFTVNIIAAASGTPYAVSNIAGGACATVARTTINAASNNNSVGVPLLDATGAIIASVNANSNNLDQVITSLYRNISGTVRTDGIGQRYLDRNITITPATQPTTGLVDVRLYYTNPELVAFQGVVPTATAATVSVTKTPAACAAAFSGAPTSLDNQGNGNLGTDWYVDVKTPSFSTFYIEDVIGGALPVNIEYINGTKQSNGNIIDWKVSCTSVPEVTMELQRSSDARNFRTIYTETATAVRCLQAFIYNDATPVAGLNYYRVKVTEPNGSVKYSSIVLLVNKDKGYEIVSIAPNPVKAITTLTLSSAKAGKVDIVINDAVGRLIAKQQNTLVAGSNNIVLNFEKLASGTYNILVTNTDGEVKTTRFVKY